MGKKIIIFFLLFIFLHLASANLIFAACDTTTNTNCTGEGECARGGTAACTPNSYYGHCAPYCIPVCNWPTECGIRIWDTACMNYKDCAACPPGVTPSVTPPPPPLCQSWAEILVAVYNDKNNNCLLDAGEEEYYLPSQAWSHNYNTYFGPLNDLKDTACDTTKSYYLPGLTLESHASSGNYIQYLSCSSATTWTAQGDDLLSVNSYTNNNRCGQDGAGGGNCGNMNNNPWDYQGRANMCVTEGVILPPNDTMWNSLAAGEYNNVMTPISDWVANCDSPASNCCGGCIGTGRINCHGGGAVKAPVTRFKWFGDSCNLTNLTFRVSQVPTGWEAPNCSKTAQAGSLALGTQISFVALPIRKLTPTPTQPLACQNLYTSSATPNLGEAITLTCEKTASYTGAVAYDFMLIQKENSAAADPNPTPTPFVSGATDSTTAYTFPTNGYGYYLFMCRVCSGATCTSWQNPGTTSPTNTPTPTTGESIPTNTPTSVIPPTATPVPATIILLNSSSGISCDAVCSAQGRTCASVGTDAAATDMKKWSTRCSFQDTTCAEGMAPGTRDCSGHIGMWTNCRCTL